MSDDEQAAELEVAFESMPEALVVFGADGEARRSNATARRLGLAVGPSVPRPWLQPDGQPFAPERDPLRRALTGEEIRGELLQVRTRGTTRWLSVSVAPIRREGGRTLGAAASFVDVTRLHELQEQRNQLVHMLSHDLRTPLSALMLQAQMLVRAKGDGQQVSRRARSIVTSAQRMATMIQDLVDLARLETGQLPLALEPLDVRRFVLELLERLGGTLEVDSRRLRVEIPEGLPPALADPARLERILVNLISNALKYSAPDTEVTVRGARAGGAVALAVVDRGQGIAREELPRLFERYFRGAGARDVEGLGLGLFITRLLVEAHHGSIEVESRVGEGSTFRVLLPAAPSAEGTKHAAAGTA